jgi:hypothetical protein
VRAQRSSFPTPSTTFSSTKKDKRIIKHSLLLSKVRKSSGQNLGPKRRRPNKKLVTTLQSLVDALPEELEEYATISKSSAAKAGIIKQDGVQSMKINRGVSKRKEKLLKEETERFGKNLAVLSQAGAGSKESAETGSGDSRWAALRRHLQENMVK